MTTTNTIKDQLLTLLSDYKDFNSTPIETQPVPNTIQFAKQVSKGYPCLYRAYDKIIDRNGKLQTWTDQSLLQFPAFIWTKHDLLSIVDDEIEVAITPSGRADDIHNIDGQEEPVFLSPATMQMTLGELLDKLDSSAIESTGDTNDQRTGSEPVYYLQSQNSNLTTTSLSPILKRVPPNFPFAEPVLSEPEAINIWIGDHRSTTSTHRDPYENLYLVLKGTKTFTLYPPVDEITLSTRFVRTGSYTFDPTSKTFSTTIDESENPSEPPPRIPWVTVNPLLPHDEIIAQHPLYEHASPRMIKVHEGEILYLPSGWYHHVQQECGVWDEDGSVAPCIAVNYWFDMEYEGEKYVMRQLVGRLVSELRNEEVTNRSN